VSFEEDSECITHIYTETKYKSKIEHMNQNPKKKTQSKIKHIPQNPKKKKKKKKRTKITLQKAQSPEGR